MLTGLRLSEVETVMPDFDPVLPDEGINVDKSHPLANIFIMLFGTVVILAICYSLVGVFSDFIADRISLDQEKKIGAVFISTGLIPELSSSRLASNSQVSENIRRLGETLWQPYSRDNKRPTPEFAIRKVSFPNAFTYPGAKILVTSTLLEQATSENEISFVICHELGHYYFRHPLKHLGRGLFFLLISTVIDFSANSSEVLTSGFNMATLNYSREQEERSDSFALGCLNKKYGHVNGFEHFFKKIEKLDLLGSNNFKILKYSRTHPLTSERIQNLKEEAVSKGYRLNGGLKPSDLYQ
ncbi:MAG: M48 family metallopeptidase [Bdellovibrionota bacterium]